MNTDIVADNRPRDASIVSGQRYTCIKTAWC